MIKQFSIVLFAFILCFPAYVTSQVLGSAYRKGNEWTAEKWQVNDITFKGKSERDANPFHVVFGAIYTGPDGQSRTVPGFFNGNDEWVSRFSSSEEGNWTFETYSSKPELSGLTGQVTITPNTRPDQKGAVVIDPRHPQAFVYEDGDSHFMLAFELDWLFALDYGNESGLPKTQQLLTHAKENGFNHIVANIYAYDVRWGVADD